MILDFLGCFQTKNSAGAKTSRSSWTSQHSLNFLWKVKKKKKAAWNALYKKERYEQVKGKLQKEASQVPK